MAHGLFCNGFGSSCNPNTKVFFGLETAATRIIHIISYAATMLRASAAMPGSAERADRGSIPETGQSVYARHRREA